MEKNMKNVLITGGLGHIGSKLIRELTNNYNVTVVDDFHTQRYCSLFDLAKPINFIESSFVDTPEDIIEKSDIIIHLAAITNASKSFGNKDLEDVNIQYTKEFIDKCTDITNGTFIFPSSTSVYGVASELVTEDNDDYLNPQSPYAESKIEIERYLSTKDINHIILRFGTIFGCSPGMRFHTAINKFCYQAALREPLTVWEQNYEQYRPYLGINDCIRAINLFANSDIKNQTYNVITDNFKLSEIIDYIKSVTPIDLNMVDTPLINQYSYKVNVDKLLSLGFAPQDSLHKEISSTVGMLRCIKNY
jgi:nucleoside-diphosphate-sugar epimerase